MLATWAWENVQREAENRRARIGKGGGKTKTGLGGGARERDFGCSGLGSLERVFAEIWINNDNERRLTAIHDGADVL